MVQARAEAAYLGLALGDALGATVEFMTPREIQSRYGVHREIRGGGWLNIKPGQVTDDTTMALALGRAILADGGEVRALSCARAFDDWMRSKPVDIGNTVRRNLVAFFNNGFQFIRILLRYPSRGKKCCTNSPFFQNFQDTVHTSCHSILAKRKSLWHIFAGRI